MSKENEINNSPSTLASSSNLPSTSASPSNLPSTSALSSTLPSTSASSSPSSEKPGSVDQGEVSESEESLSVPVSLIGAENYLTLTEGKLNTLTKDELTEAALECKKLIVDSAVCSNERKWLVRRLIELRYQLMILEDSKETAAASEPVNARIVLGHHFELKYQPSTSTTKRYCDACCGAVWNFVQYFYQCTACRYRCHPKCADQVVRPCPQLLSSDKPFFETKIRPEIGLAEQNYQCADCKLSISFSSFSWKFPRLCDYTGLYYCTSCHWNNSAVVPARVVRNWDLSPYLVSRAAYQLLRYMRNQPLLRPDKRLFGFVQELAEIKRRREELSYIKMYLVRCREAKEEKKLLWKKFGTRSHLLEPSEVFSLRDLIELHSGKLLEEINPAVKAFISHITVTCTICKGQGYRCELCEDKEDIIFPFYSDVYICPECSWVYHKTCMLQKNTCRKCDRIKRKSQENLDSGDTSL